jgi:hypothetical protein
MPEVIINGPEGRLEARYMPAIDPTGADCPDPASRTEFWRQHE